MSVSLYKDVKCQGYSSYYSYRADVKENSYDITKNTSNVTIDFYINDTGSAAGFKNYQSCQFGIWVDGVKKAGGQSAATTIYGGDYVHIGSWTGDVAHDTDGKKEITVGLTFRCSSSTYYSDAYLPCQNDGSTSYPSGTDLIWSMGKVALTTIPRASALTASDGTLGTSQKLTVTRYSTSFTHTITYTCGSASGTICTKSSNTSISFTPPLDLASQNTTGVKVSIAFTIITYNGSAEIGRATKTITCAMPASVKPSCSLSVTDAMGYAETYGGYIKGQSKFEVVVTSAGVYGATITSRKTTVDGVSYTWDSFTTDVIKSTGTLTITCTVTDSRGRTETASVNVTVLDYVAPSISALTAVRCDSNGTANEKGEYIKITFSSAVTSLSSKNTATYTAKYKKSTATSYTSVVLTNYNNNYAVSSGVYIFAADTGSSYDIALVVADAFGDISRATDAPTGFAIMHWKADGTAVGIGKIAEKSYSLDMGVDIELNDKTVLREGVEAFAPFGYGSYGEILTGVSLSDESNFESFLDGILADMKNNQVYRFRFTTNTMAAVTIGDWTWMATIIKTSASYAFVSAQSGFGNRLTKIEKVYSNGSWLPCDWVNPPMALGVEYRTTERWNGKAVYTKLINYGGMPNSTRYAVAHGASATQILKCIGTNITTGISIPNDTVSVFADKSNITIITTASQNSSRAYVQIWYTKD